jgi:hypothetical protein
MTDMIERFQHTRERIFHLISQPGVKGGGKVRRVADQNRGTPALCTPHDTGCQLFPIHFSDTSSSSGPGSSGSA